MVLPLKRRKSRSPPGPHSPNSLPPSTSQRSGRQSPAIRPIDGDPTSCERSGNIGVSGPRGIFGEDLMLIREVASPVERRSSFRFPIPRPAVGLGIGYDVAHSDLI